MNEQEMTKLAHVLTKTIHKHFDAEIKDVVLDEFDPDMTHEERVQEIKYLNLGRDRCIAVCNLMIGNNPEKAMYRLRRLDSEDRDMLVTAMKETENGQKFLNEYSEKGE